jgi:hypothetical protein
VGYAGVAALFLGVGVPAIVAFLAWAAYVHRFVAAAAMVLLGMGLGWVSMVTSSGAIQHHAIRWLLPGIGMLVAGLVVLRADRARVERHRR